MITWASPASKRRAVDTRKFVLVGYVSCSDLALELDGQLWAADRLAVLKERGGEESKKRFRGFPRGIWVVPFTENVEAYGIC